MSAIHALQTFDPYQEWLGVSAPQRPLSPYQLLGLRPMEDDAETVRGAISRQRRAMEQQRGTHRQVTWNEVKSELEQAAATLLNPRRKAEFDAAMFERQSESGVRQLGTAPAGFQVECPKCGQAGTSERKFCSSCGTRLLAPCLNCGAPTWLSERFCGGCGSDQAKLLKTKSDQLGEYLTKADEFRFDCRFDEARSVLRAMPQMHDDRFAALRERAQRLIAELETEAAERRAAAKAAAHDADCSFATRDYAAAVRVLDEVPPALRDEHMQARLLESQRKLEEITALRAGVRAAAQANRREGLLGKVERLLELAPRDEWAKNLAGQLRSQGRVEDVCKRDELMQAARAALARNQYEQAEQFLAEVAEPVRGKDFRELSHQVEELAFLSWDLRHAPYADETLVGIAERLLKLQPADKQTLKLLAAIKERRAAASKPAAAPPRWARVPEKPHVGLPVVVGYGLDAVAVSPEVAAAPAFVTHGGSYHVACGLALQGVGLAAVEMNLFPESGKFMDRLSKLIVKRPTDRAWGLDIGSCGLKAVRLTREKKSRQAVLTACDHIEHSLPLGRPEAEKDRLGILRETLRKFLERNEVKGHRVCVTLPRVSTLGRFFKLPPFAGEKRLAEAVRYEATQQIPFPLEELVWDYHIFGATADDSSIDANYVVLQAAKQLAIKQCLEVFAELELTVDIVQADCVALHNYFTHGATGLQEAAANASGATANSAAEPTPATAVVDVGGDALSVVVTAPDLLWFRSASFGGDGFTAALARTLRLSHDQAEKLKRDPLLGKRLKTWDDVLRPLREEFVHELQRPLEAYRAAHRDRQVQRMICVGGGMKLHGLLRHLRHGR